MEGVKRVLRIDRKSRAREKAISGTASPLASGSGPNNSVPGRPQSPIADPVPLTGRMLSSTPSKDLWRKAMRELPDEDQTAIQQSGALSELDVLQHLSEIIQEKRDNCEAGGWKFEYNGRQIVLRDLGDKIILWINKFKEVGDIAANFDPVHASLPWALTRFLLQVY